MHLGQPSGQHKNQGSEGGGVYFMFMAAFRFLQQSAFGAVFEACQESQIDPWPRYLGKYRNTPPIFLSRYFFRGRHGGVGKKSGVENLTNDTPPPPLVRYVFHPPQVSLPCFSCARNPRQSRPEALLEGSQNFRESVFSGTFFSPHTFCTPPYHGPTFAKACHPLGRK